MKIISTFKPGAYYTSAVEWHLPELKFLKQNCLQILLVFDCFTSQSTQANYFYHFKSFYNSF